jgi:hypothetical protein
MSGAATFLPGHRMAARQYFRSSVMTCRGTSKPQEVR